MKNWFPEISELCLLVVLLLVMVIPLPVYAATPDGGTSSVGTLILDNKDAAWQRISDGKYGVFTNRSRESSSTLVVR
jgi:PDZ domain-containing secreted protein